MNAPTEAELRAFIGPRADAYWRRWRWYIARDRRLAGTLWPPFLFNFVWFLYRRMYRELWVPFAIVVATSVVQVFLDEMFFAGGVGHTRASINGDRITGLVAAIATSYAGSALYLRRLRRAATEARVLELEGDQRETLLRNRGGTNRLAAAVAALVLGAMTLLSLATAR